ncbi:Bis(5'-nucleosyl)-tetraphosphatase [asymmetrical] [Trichinella sp. T9]|nr:Bis(5'-nucleosyl)-tetraphosphatase [asymmetrical] [Trichinella sp. T9]KRX67293.1 Bis(5'-nucleosyl)-tetraphosphatase [asymmetrical] [Trichinella sp. T9]
MCVPVSFAVMIDTAEVRAAGIIIFRVIDSIRQYLLLQAAYEPHHWSPPKGRLEKDEKEFVAATREVFEETGLSENDYSIIAGFSHQLHYEANHRQKMVTYWLAKVVNTTTEIRLSMEHDHYCWCSLEDAKNLIEHSNMLEMMLRADQFLSHRRITSS